MANEFVVKNGAISPNLQLTGSTSGSSTLVASATASGTLTLPAATDTLVGKATTDTLTNKTIAAGSNTISGLTNSNLSGSAGITNANLANSSITINGSAISLGGSVSNLALTTGNLSQFAATTSAQLLGVISDETGSGALVFGTSPTITTSVVAGSASMDIFNTTATTVNAFGAATTISLGAATGTLTLNNANTVITGNLTVNGTTTTINATTITVDDINIELGSVATPTDITAAGGGITLKGATDKTISWSSTNGWTSSETFNLASGKTYKINGTDVLSSSTLGSGVTASSLTSVGTITTGTWSGSFGAVSGANLTSLTAGNLTGTIPSTVLGNSTVYVGTTAVTLNRASANLALTGISSIALPGATSGTITITPAAVAGTTAITIPATAGTLVTTGDTGSVTSTMIADGTIVNADINASAAIAVSKLAASTISGITLGNNLNTLTLNVSGTGLSGSTTYNGSAAATFTVTSNATNANTASAIVARDASGNFSAGTITATLSGNASTATSASQIDGIEFRNGNSTNGTAPDNITDNGTGYVTTVSLFGQTDGALYSQAYSSSWVHQIYGDYRTGQLAVRGKNSGTWQAWRSILDSSNYSSYALPLSGGTLTGKVTFPSSIADRPQFPGGLLSLDLGDADADIWGISRDYYPSNATAANAWGMRWNAANNEIQFVGSGTNRHIFDLDDGKITTTGAIQGTTLTSTIATGTAPLSIASTTLVTNLNADYLDGLHHATAATGSTVVARDANGDINSRYCNANYHNSSDDVSTGTLTYLMGKFGDNYHRSATAAKVAAFLSGQTMNIAGTASSETLATVTARGAQATGSITMPAGNDIGYGFWTGTSTYSIAMGNSASYLYGPVTDYSIKLNMGAGAGRGITFGQYGSAPVAAINTTSGNMQIAGSFYAASKSFLIDHPTKPNKKLVHGSLEGPEHAVYVRGKLKGSSVIELPEYWTKLVDPDSITVNLTCIGKYQKLYVMEIKDNKVYVGNENLWGADFECFYTVYGERVDVDKLEVEID